MEFKYLKDYDKKANKRYIYNIYGYKKGIIESNYEFVKKRTLKYIESSVEILEWFNQTYEKIENYNINDYIKILDINSEYYNSLDKKEKRWLNYLEKILYLKIILVMKQTHM